MIPLQEQVAIVTGGSRGIGRATVRLLAECGARVVFSYHTDLPAAHSLERAVADAGGEAIAVPADLRRRAEAEALVEEAEARFGRVDCLVANAGVWTVEPIPVEEMTDEEWDGTLDLNLKGTFFLCRAVLPGMKKRRSGRIILVSSTAGQRGEAYHSHYAASKSALIGLTKSLAVENAPHGVLINCVAPGWVDTDMTAPVLSTDSGAAVLGSIPLHRPGRPEEIAGAILFLASHLASYVTGEVLNVNGGSVLCG